MSSEYVEVGLRIRFEGDSKAIGARITQHEIYSTRFDVLAHTVDKLFAQLRSEFTSLPQVEPQQRADARNPSLKLIKFEELKCRNDRLREAVNALWNTNDQLTLEIAALRAENETLRSAIDAAREEGGAT